MFSSVLCLTDYHNQHYDHNVHYDDDDGGANNNNHDYYSSASMCLSPLLPSY